MDKAPERSKTLECQTITLTPMVSDIIETVQCPLLLLDQNLKVEYVNAEFLSKFGLIDNAILGREFYQLDIIPDDISELKASVESILSGKGTFKGLELYLKNTHAAFQEFIVNGTNIQSEEKDGHVIMLTFKSKSLLKPVRKQDEFYIKSLKDILTHAPAMICFLRGPDFIFEIANEGYHELIGQNRSIIGKPLREALPETIDQGFIEILDKVYETGKPYLGHEVPITIHTGKDETKNSFLDFVYQPTTDGNGEVDGVFVYVVDVTQQVLIRKKVEESEQALRNLIDTLPAMIWITNPNGESNYLNKNWYDYTGQNLKEAEGYGWVDVVHPDDQKATKENFVECNNKREPFSAAFRLRFNDGSFRWVIFSGRPKYDAVGKYEGMLGTVVDVHEEKIKEKLRVDTEHQYQELIHSSPSLIATFKGENFIVEIANEAIIEVWGKGADVIGKPLLEVVPEVVDQGLGEILKEVYTTGTAFKGYEMPIQLERNGKRELFYFNFIYYPQRDAEGNIVGIVDIATEVTPQAILNKKIKESESNYLQMADCMPDKVANANPAGEFYSFNQKWMSYTGLGLEELKTRGWSSTIHPEERKAYERIWKKSLATSTNFEIELRILDSVGKYKWHLSRTQVVKDENGEVKMWISINTETQRIKEEEKRKGDFLKMVSHELKTPITSIKGYVQLLLSMVKANKEGKVASFPLQSSLERIDHQVIRLTRLISEMLDLSRIEENKLELQKETFSINDLVDQTVQDIIYTNTQHDIKIHHDFKCEVFADRDRIGQVLINFIINAIKYSPDNRMVEVFVQKAENNEVAVSVVDQGIGIEKKDHIKIFKRFYRISGKNEETFSGFGIGLYLAHEIIQRHKGNIKVNSEKGKGSQFIFTLSIASNET